MTDKQPIENMAQILFDTVEDAVTFKQTSVLGERVAINCYKFAEALYNENYRQVPENAVVLTQEEYDNMFTFKTIRGGFYSILNTIRKAQRQETAKEWREKMTTILLTLFKRGWTSAEEYNLWITEINEFAKQYGVEV